jgi:hypothetical protein
MLDDPHHAELVDGRRAAPDRLQLRRSRSSSRDVAQPHPSRLRIFS